MDTESVGASVPMTVVWLTYSSTTAWLGVAETDAAAGTVATARRAFLRAGDHHVVDQLRVGVLEGAGQPVPGGIQIFRRRCRACRTATRSVASLAAATDSMRGDSGTADRTVLPLQIACRDREQQRQGRQHPEGEHLRPVDRAPCASPAQRLWRPVSASGPSAVLIRSQFCDVLGVWRYRRSSTGSSSRQVVLLDRGFGFSSARLLVPSLVQMAVVGAAGLRIGLRHERDVGDLCLVADLLHRDPHPPMPAAPVRPHRDSRS